jgi:hypothetical protein
MVKDQKGDKKRRGSCMVDKENETFVDAGLVD